MTTPRKPSRHAIRRLVGEIGPDDGVDPRELARRQQQEGRKGLGRKTGQLCQQVARTVDLLLAEQSDDLLRDLHVVDVAPAPDESRLLVTVTPSVVAGAETVDPAAVLERLSAAAGMLRVEVAAAITRRRAPSLDFRYALPPTGSTNSTS